MQSYKFIHIPQAYQNILEKADVAEKTLLATKLT